MWKDLHDGSGVPRRLRASAMAVESLPFKIAGFSWVTASGRLRLGAGDDRIMVLDAMVLTISRYSQAEELLERRVTD